MHIETLYCSTYKQSEPIRGHMDVRLDTSQMIRVSFNDEESAAIQQIAVRAFERAAETIANQIVEESPRLLEISVAAK